MQNNWGRMSETQRIISLASFVMLMPQTVATMAMQNGEAVDSTIAKRLRLDFLGGQGLFIGMIVALVVTQLYAYLSKKILCLNYQIAYLRWLRNHWHRSLL